MKTILQIVFLVIVGNAAFPQPKPVVSRPDKDFPSPRMNPEADNFLSVSQNPVVFSSALLTVPDSVVIQTNYDLQTRGSSQNRIYLYPDGTIGATCTMSHDLSSSFPDRGTGYTYFNGSTWGPKPTTRIESVRTGWPSYAPFGATGEIVIAHQIGTDPLIISKRNVKGSGPWIQSELAVPAGAYGLLWPRLVTCGPDHTCIHVICLTTPFWNGGTVYQGLDGALVYNRSLDGGTTWDGWQILPGMTSNEYLGFEADSYTWAEPKGNTIAFTYGSNWYDFALMKSTDNGSTWTKTTIWPCPYNKWTGGDSVPVFWCLDGFLAAAIDNNGKVHVSGGLNRASGSSTGSRYWYKWTDGLLYWNEDMPVWPPVLDPAALQANGNYIGWVQDTAVWSASVTTFPDCRASMTGIPTFVIDNEDNIYIFWTSLTNYRDPSDYMLRHIYARAKPAASTSWCDSIIPVTSDTGYNHLDCMYPSASPTCSGDNLYFIFQSDPISGSYVLGGSSCGSQSFITTNDIVFMKVKKDNVLIVGEKDYPEKPVFTISQAIPNPANKITRIFVTVNEKSDLKMNLTSLVGQTVVTLDKGEVPPGTYRFDLDVAGVIPGIYFYTVRSHIQAKSGKLIVQ